MLRCAQPAEGTYEVTFRHLHGMYDAESEKPEGWVDYSAEIGEHGDLFDTFPADHPAVDRRGAVKRDSEGQPIVLEIAPRVLEATPYVGELCVHELAWVQTIPGRVFNRNRRYAVRRIEGGE